jgi:hypothetical protein
VVFAFEVPARTRGKLGRSHKSTALRLAPINLIHALHATDPTKHSAALPLPSGEREHAVLVARLYDLPAKIDRDVHQLTTIDGARRATGRALHQRVLGPLAQGVRFQSGGIAPNAQGMVAHSKA